MDKLDMCLTLPEFLEECLKKIDEAKPIGIGFILVTEDNIIFHQFKLGVGDAIEASNFLQTIAEQERKVLRN